MAETIRNLLLEIPSRSTLYSIPPIGTGTVYVESLTSYVSRLINAHNLNSGVFFTKIIYPYLGKETYPRDGFTPRKSCTFNNFHQRSKELVSALTDLTTNSNLEEHSLINFSAFLSNYEVRSIKYWCPYCFQASEDSKQPVFEKLLWAFDAVEICHIHNCKLICCCPTCNTDQYHLSRSGIMGYCYKCGSWLGYRKNDLKEELSAEYLHWQQWVIENIEDILIMRKWEIKEINRIWINYKDNIKEYFTRVIERNLITKTEFFNYAKVPSRLYYYWEKGEQRLSLNSMLKLCYVTKTSLKEFLLKDFELGKGLKQLPDFIYNNIKYKAKKKYDEDELRKKIFRVINDKNNPPPSLSQVAKLFGYKERKTLRAKLPYETDIIIQNYNNYKSEENKKRKSEISTAITKLLDKGIYPSQKSIEVELGKTSYFWKRTNRILLNEICKELGVTRKKGPHTKIEIK